MIQIEWDDRLTTGVPEIDAQHQEIFNRFNRLLKACEAGRSRDEVGSLLSFMNDYIDHHFTDEENFLKHMHYPHLVDHLQKHRQFSESFTMLADNFAARGNSVQMVIKLSKLLGQLIFGHIQEEDMAFVQFMQAGRTAGR